MSAFRINKVPENQPLVIAGPCMAESKELMDDVAHAMCELAGELNFTYVFKSSFDKANRSSISSDRGPGIEKAGSWILDIKKRYNISALTDIHETSHVKLAAEFADILQIPAFLCRQTDLLVAAVETGKSVNVKKGQFLAPEASSHIVSKAKEAAAEFGIDMDLALTERGASFGYGDLIVDMRSLKVMAETGVPVIFDITHSCQKPAAAGSSKVSGGARAFAPVLARSAVASGYVDGLFLEVHPNPSQAKSDAQVQLSIAQATSLLRQVIPLWKNSRNLSSIDSEFKN